MQSMALLALAGFVAGAMNAVAGGGSFVSFPALVLAGLPAVDANASNTVAMTPGNFAGALGYRAELSGVQGAALGPMLAMTLAGGLAGALLLLLTPAATFDAVVPWLMLLATLAFAFGSRLGAWLRRGRSAAPATLLAGQFLLAIYGGYFGGAVGLMMMAAWSLCGLDDIKAMNALKTLMVGAANLVAAVCFALSGAVWWAGTLLVGSAAVIGGYAGARLGRRLEPKRVRLAITMLNVAMTAVCFLRTA